MLTINRTKRVPASTAKTVAAIKRIAAGIRADSPMSVENIAAGLHESWAEEVEMGMDAARLVRVMIR